MQSSDSSGLISCRPGRQTRASTHCSSSSSDSAGHGHCSNTALGCPAAAAAAAAAPSRRSTGELPGHLTTGWPPAVSFPQLMFRRAESGWLLQQAAAGKLEGSRPSPLVSSLLQDLTAKSTASYSCCRTAMGGR